MKNFILILFGYTICVFAQHGVGTMWGNQTKIPQVNSSAKQRGVLYNNMVATSSGRIIISTVELNPSNLNQSYGYYLTYSDDGGRSWLTPPVRFTPIDNVVGGSSLKLVSIEDTIYAFWNSSSPSAIFVSKLDKDLNILVDSVRIANKINYNISATNPTSDRYNRLHIMWNEGSTNSSQITEVYYSRSLDGGLSWQTPQLLSSNDGHHSAFPHSQFDSAGDTLVIVWRDSVGGLNKWDVLGSFSTNGGLSWSSSPVSILNTSNSEWDPDLIIDYQNRIHLFYTVYPSNNPFWGARNYYLYSDDLGITWHQPVNPSDGMISANYRSQLLEGTRYDPVNNILYTSWKDERDFNTSNGNVRGDIMINYSTDRGITWAGPEFITDAYDSTTGFKASTILPNGEYCTNYEIIYPEDLNNPSTFVGVFFKKRNPVITTINQKFENVPVVNFSLEQNYPNPFNPATKISWQSPVSGHQTLKVYDILGNEIATLVDEHRAAGRYEINFNAREISSLVSGVYVYKLFIETGEQSGNFLQVKKMIFMK